MESLSFDWYLRESLKQATESVAAWPDWKKKAMRVLVNGKIPTSDQKDKLRKEAGHDFSNGSMDSWNCSKCGCGGTFASETTLKLQMLTCCLVLERNPNEHEYSSCLRR